MNERYGLPEETIAMIAAVFTRHPEVERVILYGSRAKGNYRSGSDIDLALQGVPLQVAAYGWELQPKLIDGIIFSAMRRWVRKTFSLPAPFIHHRSSAADMLKQGLVDDH